MEVVFDVLSERHLLPSQSMCWLQQHEAEARRGALATTRRRLMG